MRCALTFSLQVSVTEFPSVRVYLPPYLLACLMLLMSFAMMRERNSRLTKEAQEEHESKKAELHQLSSTHDEELEKLRQEHEKTREAEERQLR